MRIVEVEDPAGGGSRFLADGKPVDVSCRIVEAGGRMVCVFYDADLNLLYDPSAFVTREMPAISENSVRQMATALKLLETFSKSIGVPFRQFSRAEASGFMQFLRGTLSDGTSISFDLRTARSEATVGAYLKHVRSYARSLGCDSSPFLERADSSWARRAMTSAAPLRLRATPAPEFEAPRYFSIPQYRSIREELHRRGDVAGTLLCRLMFEHGLRIGEALGLTTEDLKSSVGRDGNIRHWIVLRNRATDRPWMKAKNLLDAKSEATYRSPEYRKRRVGYQSVYVSGSLFGEIADYAEVYHPSTSPDCRADSVEGGEVNEYLFVNREGRPLSAGAWNKRLRSVLQAIEIPVDKGTRSTNLNHRFRHGYAMLLTNVLGCGEYEVMTLMRHRSIHSTEVYHRPTEEDVWRMQREIVGEIEEELFGGSEDG